MRAGFQAQFSTGDRLPGAVADRDAAGDRGTGVLQNQRVAARGVDQECGLGEIGFQHWVGVGNGNQLFCAVRADLAVERLRVVAPKRAVQQRFAVFLPEGEPEREDRALRILIYGGNSTRGNN